MHSCSSYLSFLYGCGCNCGCTLPKMVDGAPLSLFSRASRVVCVPQEIPVETAALVVMFDAGVWGFGHRF